MTLPFMPSALFLAVKPVDIRPGVDGLSAHVQECLGQAPCDGSVYAFRNRAGTRIKLLVWDGSGVWWCVRRLHKGRFVWPGSTEPVWQMSAHDWHYLISGVDWRRLSASTQAQWQV